MASVSFNVSYTQSADDAVPGVVDFNGDTQLASGRLDNVGDFVFAEGFVWDTFAVTVECTRTSHNKMRIRLVFVGSAGYYVGSDDTVAAEKILDNIPIEF